MGFAAPEASFPCQNGLVRCQEAESTTGSDKKEGQKCSDTEGRKEEKPHSAEGVPNRAESLGGPQGPE